MSSQIARPQDVAIAKVRIAGAVKTLDKILRAGPDRQQLQLHYQKIQLRLQASLADSPQQLSELAELRRKIQSRTGKLIALAEVDEPSQLQAVLARYHDAMRQLDNAQDPIPVHDILIVRDPTEMSPMHRAWEVTDTATGHALLMLAFRQGRPDAMVTVARKLLAIPRGSPLIRHAIDILYTAAQRGSVQAEYDLLTLAREHARAQEAVESIRELRATRLLNELRREHRTS